MSGVPDPATHDVTRDDVWRELGQQRNDLTDVKSSLAGLLSEVRMLAQVMNRQSQPFNWVSVSSLIVSVLLACGFWVNHAQKPLEANLTRHEEGMTRLIDITIGIMEDRHREGAEDARAHGELSAHVSNLTLRLDRVEEEEKKSIEHRGSADARSELMMNWLNKVDNMGSRVHIKPTWATKGGE